MDWVITGMRYAPLVVNAIKAITTYVSGEGNNGRATADMVKPLVDIGLNVLAENTCGDHYCCRFGNL